MKRYIRSSADDQAEDAWIDMCAQLRDEYYSGIDSLGEMTDAGSALQDICIEIEDSLGLFVEPFVQGGEGGVWIYDKDGNVLVENLDIHELDDAAVGIALSSDYKGFRPRWESYLRSWFE